MVNRVIKLIDLGRMKYGDALALQKEFLAKRIAGKCGDTLLLVEHEPVITLGRHADAQHILASKEALAKFGIGVFQIERGGDVTYHGPGQQVGYPIFNIREMGLSLHDYLRLLEETMIVALSAFGLSAHRISGLTGVFVDDAKLVAIGIAVKKWVTFHGFAFNVNPNMHHFELIVPCGIREHPVGSLSGALGETKSLSDLRPHLISAFERVFGITITD
ncbi:MAG: lipoyl(octanoyl) transferase LipB [bacterium]|jgi:lipoate-protein ligase B